MADAFRGLTLRLGADARPLNQAINSIKQSASQAQSQLRAMGNALKVDATNATALQTRLDLAEDKATLTARAAENIGRAIRQASGTAVTLQTRTGAISGTMSEVAARTKEVYSATQKARSEYNHVNDQLEVIHNAVRKVVAAEKGWEEDSEKLDAYMTKLKQSYQGTSDAAKKLTAEMRRYLGEAVKQNQVTEMFGWAAKDAKNLIYRYGTLRREHKITQEQLSNVKSVEGFRAMKTQLVAFEMELRQASMEAVRFRTELHAVGGEGLRKALSDAKSLDAAIDAARESTRAMTEAFQAMPTSAEAASAKARAMRNEYGLVTDKLQKAKSVLRQIEADPAFNKQARSITNTHQALATAENDMSELTQKIKKAELAYEALNKEISEGNKAKWKGTERGFSTVMADIRKTKTELEKYYAEYEKVEAQHRSAAIADTYRRAREEVVRLEAEAKKLDPMLNRLKTLGEKFSTLRTMGYGLYSTITPVLMMAGRYAINSAEQIDASYRNMRKTVNGTEEDFEALKSAAIEFSRSHVTSADQILEIESIGGQLGIAVENLEAFGEVVSNLDIATNIDAEDIATYIGQLSNIMDDIDTENAEQYEKDITSFSDALVRLGNNSAAQESKIMKVMMRIASLGNISGFSTAQLLGISTAVAATGQGAEAAGTAIARTFSNMEAAVGGGGEKLQAFAQVAGMSAQDFASAWEGDPMTAFQAFIGGLRAIDDAGGSVDNTLASLGINSVRQKQALEGLTNTFDVMTEAVGMSGDAWAGMSSILANGTVVEKAGDAAREAHRKSEGFSGAIQMLRNNAAALGATLAEGAAPMIQGLGEAFKFLTGIVTAMPGPMKTATVALLGIVAALGPTLVAVGAVGDAWVKLKNIKQAKMSKRAELIADATAALQEAVAVREDARQQERYALAQGHAAANAGKSEHVKKAAATASAAHAAAVAAETKVEEANTRVTVANGGVKGTLIVITEALTAATTKLATALGISNAMLLGFAGVAAGVVIACLAINAAVDPANQLTKRTQELRNSAEEAKARYEQMSKAFGENSEEALKAKAAYEDLNAELQESTKTNGQLAEEMRETAHASSDLREELLGSREEAETNAGAILNTVDSIKQLKDADDEASKSKLAAAIAMANSQIDGYSLTVKDAVDETDEYKAAMVQLENKARQMRLDNAVENYVALYNQASELENEMKRLREEAGLTDEAIALYKAGQAVQDMGFGYIDPTGGAAQAYVQLEKERQKSIDQMEQEKAAMQANIDKSTALATANRLMTQYRKDESEAIALVNDMYATNIEQGEVAAYVEEQRAAAQAATNEQLDEFVNSIAEACEKYPELDALISNSGMTYDALAQWLSDAGMSVDDFAKGVEEMAAKASDGLNKIDTESGISLGEFMGNLEANRASMENWSANMDALWDQYSNNVSESGREAVEGFLGYLGSLGPEQSALVEEIVNSGDLEGIALEWDAAGQSGREAYMSQIGVLSDAASKVADQIAQEIDSKLDTLHTKDLDIKGKIEIEDNTAEVNSNIDGTQSELAALTSSDNTVEISAQEDVTSTIDTIEYDLNHMTTYKEVEVKTILTSDDKRGSAKGGIVPNYIGSWATGGTFNRLIKTIPMNAAGAINGIATGPLLTNIGWVGEAGAEAVFHMGHAQGAVVPLSNRRYVRPFARAVANEMGGARQGDQFNVNVTVNAHTDADANEIAAVSARKVRQVLMARGR